MLRRYTPESALLWPLSLGASEKRKQDEYKQYSIGHSLHSWGLIIFGVRTAKARTLTFHTGAA